MTLPDQAACLGCGGPLERGASSLRCPRCGTGIRLAAPALPSSARRPATFFSGFLFVLGGFAGIALVLLGVAGSRIQGMYLEVGATAPGTWTKVVGLLPFASSAIVLALACGGFVSSLRGSARGLPLQIIALVLAGASMVGCLFALYLPLFSIADVVSGN